MAVALEYNGLTSREAHRRLEHDGPNVVVNQTELTGVRAFARQFTNPLIVILVVSSGLAFVLGDHVSSVIIITIVVLSAVLQFVNTYKSQQAAEALKDRVRISASVLRDGRAESIPLAQIVKGDLVQLKAGSIVPADGKVLAGEHLFANESALTGESFPQAKAPGDPLYMGSSAISGNAIMEVVATGQATKFSHIAQTLAGREELTEFDREIRDFSLLIVKITFGLVVFIFAVNAVFKHEILDALLFSLALAVGLTPELLPMIITLNLTKGSLAMAKRNVIVKKLAAIQNFGSMDVLCTDKTGTLTEDRIVLVKHVDGEGHDSDDALLFSYLSSFFATTYDNPLDAAIRHYHKLDVAAYHKLDEIPFDFERKRESIVVRHGEQRILVTKGAPEEVIKICKHYETSHHRFDAARRRAVTAEYERLSQEGFRVLAVASREVETKSDYAPEIEAEMTFVGFVAFLDPAKPSVTQTLKRMHAYGVHVKIITGDNGLVSRKIAQDIGLEVTGLLEGVEIEHLDNLELSAKLEETTIFARVNPEQKMRIIKLLKRAGHVVGYMGDGINDAPSLYMADVGISVNNAVDVAKETADLILIRKSLEDLIEGVIEGRKTYANTLKYLKMALSSNFGNMFSMAGASIFLPFLPMLAPQILFNNLLYDGSQFAIPLDGVDPDDITRPHSLSIKSIKKFMWVFGPLSSVFDVLTFVVLIAVFGYGASQFQTGWFIESIATQAFVVYVIRTKRLPFVQSRPSNYLLASTVAVVAIGWLVALGPLGVVFKFTPLPMQAVLAMTGIVLVYLVLTELVKRVFFKYVVL
jgi:P-type Mg2+ transporter